jgi:hypothetical protein
MGWIEFTPAVPVNTWRKIAVEVTPGSVTFFWQKNKVTDDKPQWGQVVLNAPDLDSHRIAQQSRLDQLFPNPRIVLDRWNPRRPVGIYARSSIVSFRNVVLTPHAPESP